MKARMTPGTMQPGQVSAAGSGVTAAATAPAPRTQGAIIPQGFNPHPTMPGNVSGANGPPALRSPTQTDTVGLAPYE